MLKILLVEMFPYVTVRTSPPPCLICTQGQLGAIGLKAQIFGLAVVTNSGQTPANDQPPLEICPGQKEFILATEKKNDWK